MNQLVNHQRKPLDTPSAFESVFNQTVLNADILWIKQVSFLSKLGGKSICSSTPYLATENGKTVVRYQHNKLYLDEKQLQRDLRGPNMNIRYTILIKQIILLLKYIKHEIMLKENIVGKNYRQRVVENRDKIYLENSQGKKVFSTIDNDDSFNRQFEKNYEIIDASSDMQRLERHRFAYNSSYEGKITDDVD